MTTVWPSDTCATVAQRPIFAANQHPGRKNSSPRGPKNMKTRNRCLNSLLWARLHFSEVPSCFLPRWTSSKSFFYVRKAKWLSHPTCCLSLQEAPLSVLFFDSIVHISQSSRLPPSPKSVQRPMNCRLTQWVFIFARTTQQSFYSTT